eukprot:CAMPEP_0114514832 /NCGR_PEP_ID=MMETSP0109-20121206/16377_1 /TAXON_ID=29199 /ORGANISM="Chlorarachnion reptans, Strain CCCM449" /LENGTH=552 /DNA_ID=CAMNT_0001694925 /DNA_START=192 /DNA_END=1850 /DNA_ORIENTATION=-
MASTTPASRILKAILTGPGQTGPSKGTQDLSSEALSLFASLLQDANATRSAGARALGEKTKTLAESCEGQPVSVAELRALLEEEQKNYDEKEVYAVAQLYRRRTRDYHSLLPILTQTSVEDFAFMGFEPGLKNVEALSTKKVLCVGAGGLGCEILKNLALSGVKNIVVIDLDTIDVSNLNRQFLFRRKDVGKPKAQVAAEFVMKRKPDVKIEWHKKKIQEFDDDFYRQFSVVVAGLDNVKARLWLNSKLYSLVQKDEDGDPEIDTIIPLVDGGTEGFSGQARFFYYPFSACFECSAEDVKEGPKFELCTIRSTPRIAEHCIAYALLLEWPKLVSLTSHTDYNIVDEEKERGEPQEKKSKIGGLSLDKDNPEHMTWLYERAKERAAKFNISGVTYNLTMQYVKNIIPAIASTNAVISAACTNEAIKYLTACAPVLDNYFSYYAQGGCYTRTFAYQKNPECFTCGVQEISMEVAPNQTLKELMEAIEKKYRLGIRSLSTEDMKILYNPGLGATENLASELKSLLPGSACSLIMSARRDGYSKSSNYTLRVSFPR